MLDVLDAKELSERRWLQLPLRAKLPCSYAQYMNDRGGDRVRAATRRRFQRAPLRGIAIGVTTGETLALYTKDVSRMGVGFYSPVNLLPRAEIRLWIPGQRLLAMRVSRCRRLAGGCFEIGASFDFGNDGKTRFN